MTNNYCDEIEEEIERCRSCETKLLWQDPEKICQGCSDNAELYAREEGVSETEWRNYYEGLELSMDGGV